MDGDGAARPREDHMSTSELNQPASATALSLGYLHTRLAFETQGVDVDDLGFFDSHFAPAPADATPTATIVLRQAAGHDVPAESARVFVRESRTEFFTVRARRVGAEQLVCETSGTRMSFDVACGRVRLDVPGPRPGRELIELVRSLVLRNEENHGVVMLHAALVELAGRAVVIAGPKGAGKTSSALELVLHHGGRLLSGDKALLLPAEAGARDRPLVAGWPDWPHLGLGTISRFPQLGERFGLDRAVAAAQAQGDLWSMRHKVPLDPDTYRTVVPFSHPGIVVPVAAVLYPCLTPDGPRSLDGCTDHVPRLAANVESSFASGTPGWNPMIAPSASLPTFVADAVARASALPAFQLRGDGVLSPADVARLRDA
jgi:hypothetical protein